MEVIPLSRNILKLAKEGRCFWGKDSLMPHEVFQPRGATLFRKVDTFGRWRCSKQGQLREPASREGWETPYCRRTAGLMDTGLPPGSPGDDTMSPWTLSSVKAEPARGRGPLEISASREPDWFSVCNGLNCNTCGLWCSCHHRRTLHRRAIPLPRSGCTPTTGSPCPSPRPGDRRSARPHYALIVRKRPMSEMAR